MAKKKAAEEKAEAKAGPGEGDAAVRCSALPRLLACPGALGLTAGPEETSAAAALGTAAHVLYQRLAQGEEPTEEDAAVLAAESGVDERELKFLLAAGRRLAKEQAGKLADAQTERELAAEVAPGLWLTGHADLTGTGEDGAAVVVDWKTGEKHDYLEQLLGYALLLKLTGMEAEKYRAVVVYTRLGETEEHEFTPAMLTAFQKRLAARLREREFRPGDACAWCPCKGGCEAWREHARAAAGELMAFGGEGAEVTLAWLGETMPKVKLLEAACRKFQQKFREALEFAGAIPGPDGKEWRFKGKVVSEAPLCDALFNAIGGEASAALLANVTVSKSKVMDALKTAGLKPAERNAVVEGLKAAGVMGEKEQRLIELV